jgi:hypothetical protein
MPNKKARKASTSSLSCRLSRVSEQQLLCGYHSSDNISLEKESKQPEQRAQLDWRKKVKDK